MNLSSSSRPSSLRMVNIRSKSNRSRTPRGPKISVRCNEAIRAPEVRLIDADGTMLGIFPVEGARMQARQAGLDLIEISANATPPVCRIADFGKFQYEITKKKKVTKPSTNKVKEVKFRFCTETHDYETKVRHIIVFLGEGNKVKISVFFRGREMNQTQLGFELVSKLTADLAPYATLDAEAKLVGRNITATYSPLKNLKQKQQAKSPPPAE
ncbi:MAG: translation initiation factor IF-3 [Verrucomicrobiota bacterium]|nr:MAG: translation initiation factor IF-3 [Verrucomicrobiota bacterium]